MSHSCHTSLLGLALCLGGCTVLDLQSFDGAASASSSSTASTSTGAPGGEGGATTSSTGSTGGFAGGGRGPGGGGQGGAGNDGGGGSPNVGGSGGSGGAAGSGGAGSSGGSGGVGGAGGSGGSPQCALSDEFDDPTTLAGCWQQISGIFATKDIDGTLAGHLTMQPVGGTGPWDEQLGPFLYKEITGNFAVVTHVVAGSVADPLVAPQFDYNMAGLFVRAPLPENATGLEDWIKWELGRRDMNVAPTPGPLAARTLDSQSSHILPYTPENTHIGGLGMCRLGNDFGLYWRQAPGDYVPVYQLTTNMGPNQIAVMPPTVQIGLIAGAFLIGQADLEAQFAYIRFGAPPSSGAECETTLETLDP